MQPKIFPFPVISPVSLDYQSNVQYKCEISCMGKNNIIVTHEIADGNIIANLLKNGDAKFGCMVSLPATMYRQLFTDNNKSLNVIQKIDYNKSGANDDTQHPMFRPVIITTEELYIKSDEKHGFNDIWFGQEIKFPPGAIIGFGDWMKFGNPVNSIFLLKEDESMQQGMMEVEADANGGFIFNIKVHKSILTFISESDSRSDTNEKKHSISILTHALSRGLEILAKDYKDNWEHYPNLKLFAQYLKDNGQPHWDKEGFCPEKVATSLYPHMPSINRSTNDY